MGSVGAQTWLEKLEEQREYNQELTVGDGGISNSKS